MSEFHSQSVHEPLPLEFPVDPIERNEVNALWGECIAEQSRFAPGPEFPAHADRGALQVFTMLTDPDMTNMAIRQRAVAAFTAPNQSDLPYDNPVRTNFRHALNLNWNGVLLKNIQDSRKYLEGVDPERVEDIAQGVLFWAEKDGESRDWTWETEMPWKSYYHGAIAQLLPYLQGQAAELLFAQYPIHDPEVYHTEDPLLYACLDTLLNDSQIPHEFKKIGLSNWIKAVRREAPNGMALDLHGVATQRMVRFLDFAKVEGDDINAAFVHKTIVDFLGPRMPGRQNGR